VISLLEKGTTTFSGETIIKYSIREIFDYSTINEEQIKKRVNRLRTKKRKIWNMLYNFKKRMQLLVLLVDRNLWCASSADSYWFKSKTFGNI
jgi:hypothetical protein